MNLNPTVRWLLTGLVGAATAAVTILADGFQPLDVLLIVIALGGTLGLTPPQAGGTQQGLSNPRVVDPPAKARPEGTPWSKANPPGAVAFWPVAAFAVRDDVSEGEVVTLVGLLLVIGCLLAAAVVAFRTRDWLVPLILCVVAVVSAFLLL